MDVIAADVTGKSVYESPEPTDGRRVLVTRYWPRGVARTAIDEYVPVLAPSRELLHAFRSGQIDWDAYMARYLQEMSGEEARGEVHRLAKAARSERITVICVCKEEEHCHRSLLRQLILSFDEGPGT